MAISNINEHIVEATQTVREWLSQWMLKDTFTSRSFLDLKIISVPASTIGGVSFAAKSVTNLDRILGQYTNAEYQEAQSQSALGDTLTIKAGTIVGLPNGVIKRQVIKSKTFPELSRLTEEKPFIANALKQLMEDPNYISVLRNQDGEQVAKTQINDISVFIWIRSITNPGDNSQEGAWYNVSAFVENVETTVTKEVGSFSMTLAPILTVYDNQVGWSQSGVTGFDSGSVREDVLSIGSISKYRNKEDNFLSRSDFFFGRALSQNDLVYIRFESLASEKNFKLYERAFGAQDIPGKIYDMIGLIDNVGQSVTPNSASISVIGRDMMKVLIEDGSIFFPEQAGQQIFTNPDSVLTKRNLIELEARALTAAAFSFKPVSTILKYLFNKFSNMGLVPSHVFNGSGENVSLRKYSIASNNEVFNELNNRFLSEERQGVYRIIEFIFDKSVALRALADNSIATDNGSIINSIRKICQEPFVEFTGDTYGDKYYFSIRKSPFDSIGYRGLIYKDVVSEDVSDGINNNSQITKLFTQGKLLRNATSKKSSTFAEVKKSVANKAKQRSILNGRPAYISDLVIDIDEVDVLSEDLDYSDEAYTWYRIIPRGLGVQDDLTSFLLSPIVPLDEYAEIWGNRAYSMEYNYSPAEFIDDSYAEKEMKYAESQAFLDLQYVMESTVYLPFTRQGTIRINGDRRIKRGTAIYYKPTDEVFYVDAVRNSRTLKDRITTLSVSRGMKEKFIKGVQVRFGAKVETVSYFNIVDLKIENDASINNNAFLKNWKVNKNVFNFFLQRRQWVESNSIL